MTKNEATLIPFLTVSNGEKALEFYKSAFGAKVITKHDMPDGKLNAKLAIGSAVFYIADEEPEFGNVSPDLKSTTFTVRMILETKNADKLFASALKYGATQICPMTTEADWRIGKLKDLFGHIWEIGYAL